MSCNCNAGCPDTLPNNQCLAKTCSVETIVGENDSCEQRAIEATQEGTILSAINKAWKARTGSQEDPINLSELQKFLAASGILVSDESGNLGKIVPGETDNGLFIGVVDGQFKMIEINKELLCFKTDSVNVESKGKVAVWGCGKDGRMCLSFLGLKNCNLAVDENGDVVCASNKFCLKKDEDKVTYSKHLAVFDNDKCLARLDIPQDRTKCYELVILQGDAGSESEELSKNRFVIREKEGSVYWIDGQPQVLDEEIATTPKEDEVDISEYFPDDECFSAATILVDCEIVAASRQDAGATVTIQGIPVLTLSSTWYKVDRARITMPIRVASKKITWKVVKTGVHNVDPKLKIRLMNLIR